MAKGLSV